MRARAGQAEDHVLGRIGAPEDVQGRICSVLDRTVIPVEGYAAAVKITPDIVRRQQTAAVEVEGVGVSTGRHVEDHGAGVERPAVQVEGGLPRGGEAGQMGNHRSHGLPIGDAQLSWGTA
ncbi:MAG: hypothetical protein EBX44_15575, partial [Betaproteobacteria bacterium]|nr:hypothetical protein [Betaproteobacteria bacterium]